MNVLFFLTPKTDVAYVSEDDSLRQVMEKMDYYKYSAVPILGDIKEMEDISVMSIDRRVENITVNINKNIEELVLKLMDQNFIPVVDDDDVFIGIVKRRDIIEYFFNRDIKNHEFEEIEI